MKTLTTLIYAAIAILLVLFFHGKVKIPNVPLPALGKFFNPASGFWNNGEKFNNTNLQIPSLKGKAEVIFDERYIPHIYASNLEDALFLQGYVEAENRLFQMEFMTRAASGRLSEVMGAVTLNFDRDRLRSQVDTAASNAAISWAKTKEYPLLLSYVAGINYYIDHLQEKDLPIEFKLLNFKPEKWTVKKSALVYKSMADVLAGKSYDMENSNMLKLLGRPMFDLLYPEKEDGGYPVIDYPTSKVKFNEKRDSVIAKVYYNQFYKNNTPGIGSNNWAVSPQKSEAGHAILCNDPHLGLSLPSIWIEEHINTPDFNAYGVSFPGFPGIMIGFNDHIAWGETNVGQDVEDVFEVRWANKEKTKYHQDGKILDAKIDYHEIKIKGKPSYIDTLKYTNRGLVRMVSADGTADLSVRWLAVDVQVEPEFMTFVDIMKANNLEEYNQGKLRFNTPAQNFLFASTKGEIGLTVNGKFPKRQYEDGRFVEPLEQSTTDWDAYIPREENPSIVNPNSGILVSANQRSANGNFPYYYTGKFEHFRNRVINDKLKSKDKHTVDDMKALQANSYSMVAGACLPIVKKVIADKNLGSAETKVLDSWDGTYTASSTAPTLFELLYDEIYTTTFDEVMQYKDKVDILYPEDHVLIELITKSPDHSIFDVQATKDIKENAEAVIAQAVKKVLGNKKSELSKTWGEYRPVDIMHYTRIPAFSAMGISTNGVKDAPNAMQRTFGPSWRMIVSMKNKIEAIGVFPGGQSGNPLSKYYRNNVETWAKNEYHILNKSAVKEDHTPVRTITIKK